MSDRFTESDALLNRVATWVGADYRRLLEDQVAQVAARFADYGEGSLRAAITVLGNPVDELPGAIGRLRTASRQRTAARERLTGAIGRGGPESKEARSAREQLRDLSLGDVQARRDGEHPEPNQVLRRAVHAIALQRLLEQRREQDLSVDRSRLWDSPSRRTPDPHLPYHDVLGPELAARLAQRVDAIEPEVARMRPSTRAGLLALQPPYETVEHHQQARQLGERCRRQEARVLMLGAQVEQLEATRYRLGVARTLRSKLEQAERDLGEARQERSSLWAEQRDSNEAWLRQKGELAALSVAAQRPVAAEVEAGIQQRERDRALDPHVERIPAYAPKASLHPPTQPPAIESGGADLGPDFGP